MALSVINDFGNPPSRIDLGFDRSRLDRSTHHSYPDTNTANPNRYRDYDRFDGYDRYDRSRYYERDRHHERRPDDYDDYPERDRYYDRYSDRGVGYDNRGYDYRPSDRGGGYRPWDQTTRGSSGWDSQGRGYYFAAGRPSTDEGPYGGSYASGWSYGGVGGARDDYYGRGR